MAKKKKKANEKKKEIKLRVPKLPKINPWMASTIALVILSAILIILPFNCPTTGGALSAEEASNRAVDYINNNLLRQGQTAELINVSEKNGLYNLKLKIGARTFDSYVTKDGSLLFPSAIELTEVEETPSQPEAFDAPDREKPTAMLFVMSFCPYGQQAEKAMKPVVDLLGNKAKIEPHYIVSVSGDTVNSLHGEYEAKEDMRQACVWREYGQTVFWEYVSYINDNCDKSNLNTCWKDAATSANINVTKVEECVETKGLSLMKEEEELADQHRVTGSPTLIINGQKYTGSRTPEAFKQAICSGFITEPEECSQQLSSTGGSPSGGCA